MPRTVTFKVEGGRELGLRLSRLREDVAKKIAVAATGAGARLIKKRAVQNIERSPAVDTGALRDAVIVKKLGKRDSSLTSEHIVTVRRRRGRKVKGNQAVAPHAIFVEFGTVKMPAEPFLRPAIEQGASEATDAIVRRLRERIDKAEQGR